MATADARRKLSYIELSAWSHLNFWWLTMLPVFTEQTIDIGLILLSVLPHLLRMGLESNRSPLLSVIRVTNAKISTLGPLNPSRLP